MLCLSSAMCVNTQELSNYISSLCSTWEFYTVGKNYIYILRTGSKHIEVTAIKCNNSWHIGFSDATFEFNSWPSQMVPCKTSTTILMCENKRLISYWWNSIDAYPLNFQSIRILYKGMKVNIELESNILTQDKL